jgi:hypothetical protein
MRKVAFVRLTTEQRAELTERLMHGYTLHLDLASDSLPSM